MKHVIRKTTEGCVIQVFDAESGDLISQEFEAGDDVGFEADTIVASSIFRRDNGAGLYHPFDMVQPDEFERLREAWETIQCSTEMFDGNLSADVREAVDILDGM